jgi:pseudaminic acid cytidylyltransferase
MTLLAIIPARGGSKRIPKKNIKEFCGKPIISYSIDSALRCNCFDEIMVSTDNEEIAKISRQYGAKVPFLRSKENSNDHAGLIDVLKEVSDEYLKLDKNFPTVCCLLPTVPFLKTDRIIEGKELLIQGKFDSVVSVTRFSYPIWRGFERHSDDSTIKMIWPENYKKRSQDFPPVFHDAGKFYWINLNVCIAKGQIFTDHTGSIEIPESEAQDIDTTEDWKIAEQKYKVFINALNDLSNANIL